MALRGRAPYSHVATAGWTLDEQGRAMSKSLGNGVDPVDIANRLGGEIVRLWVASIDFREDMAASENLMQRCADTLPQAAQHLPLPARQPATASIPAATAFAEAELLPLDRYMLARTRDLTEKILGWYEAFEFHRVYHAVNEFAIVDLSAFYLDVLKDRMYTFAPTSQARRSAQTVLWQITEALVRLVAPILTFTADEVWEYLPAVEGREASVHLALFPKPEEIFSEDPAPAAGRVEADSSPSAMKLCACLKKLARTSASAKASRPRSKSRPGESARPAAAPRRRPQGDHQCLSESRVIEGSDATRRITACSARHRPQMRPLLELHARSRPTTASGKTSAAAARARCTRWASHPPQAETSGGRPVTCPPATPPALAAAHLRARLPCRPPHQDLGRRAHSHRRSDSRHPARPPHHPLDQRGRGLLALRRLCLAARRALGLIAFTLIAALCVLVVLLRLGNRFTLTTVPSRSSSAEPSATSTTASSTARSSTSLRSTSSPITGPTST